MKALQTAAFCAFFVISVSANGQKNSSLASHQAIVFADSLLNAFRLSQWNQYIDLSYPGVISYYGGRKGFEAYVQRTRDTKMNAGGEIREQLDLIQLVNRSNEWQSVIRKTTATTIDDRKAHIITYLVGQSTDEGRTWKYFDVASNAVQNISYIMPDIFETITIPQRQIVFEKTEVAKN